MGDRMNFREPGEFGDGATVTGAGMSPHGAMLQVYVDADTMHRLGLIAAETGRPSEELVESAVAETALDYFRHRNGPIPKASDERKAT